MLLRELEPEKYWSMSSSTSREKREKEIVRMIISNEYYYQLKTDGNYSAFVCDFDGDKRIISRGISVATHEYGRLEDRLFFYDAVAAAFDKPTRIMGEIYLDGGIDRNVGSILRAAPEKAKSIQDNDYYTDIKTQVKFSAKDRKDIENNAFRNQKLKWRIFDVWYYDGIDLMNTPWIERQKYVQAAAARINHPLVSYVKSYKLEENFYEKLNDIFASGGEGVVAYHKDGKPEPGKRTAHKTMKIKQELENLIDCVITGIEPAIIEYTGKDVGTWSLWEDLRTGEKLIGQLYGQYRLGDPIRPITKGAYMGWPGAIYVSVYDDNNKLYQLCKVAGLTEEFKEELKNNFKDWYLCPVTIGGMAISETKKNTVTGEEKVNISVRHPYLKSIRKGDLNPSDCTLQKIWG